MFWGAAYGGGLPLRAAAQAHGYSIVASGWGEFIDPVGRDMPPNLTLSAVFGTVRIATLDLDATLVNFVSDRSATTASAFYNFAFGDRSEHSG